MYLILLGITPRSFVTLVAGIRQSKQIKNRCVALNDYQANLAHQYGYGYGYYDNISKDGDKSWIKRIFGGRRYGIKIEDGFCHYRGFAGDLNRTIVTKLN